eukprot:128245-Chlamydomonas_euryale.AAC.1
MLVCPNGRVPGAGVVRPGSTPPSAAVRGWRPKNLCFQILQFRSIWVFHVLERAHRHAQTRRGPRRAAPKQMDRKATWCAFDVLITKLALSLIVARAILGKISKRLGPDVGHPRRPRGHAASGNTAPRG